MNATLKKIKEAVGERKEITLKVLVEVFNALDIPIEVFKNDFDHRIMGIFLPEKNLFICDRVADKRKLEKMYPNANFCPGQPRSEEEILELLKGTFERNYCKYLSLTLNKDLHKANTLEEYMAVRRRQLVIRQTEAEKILKKELLHNGVNFAFQKVIGDKVVDFLIGKTVIEIDGGYHLSKKQQKKDKVRDADLKDMGYTVLRFSNEEVFNGPAEVTKKILHTSGL